MVEARKKPTFKRRDWNRKIRFGRRKAQKWRITNGRHNKVREKRKNRPRMPRVGYRNPVEIRGLVMGMTPVHITNLNDLSKVGKDNLAILASGIGQKKRIEIAEKASGIKFMNFSPEKFLAEIKAEKAAKESAKAEEKKKAESKEKPAKEKKSESKEINEEKK